ncbi:hypothetical protein Moror_11341 [Moniliophthora roreri MCA 2997]|uniref:Uncharacterized protein n=1 Tax=Moniliophthora roreri (strain MCA 2997) TaxID=1381753 RepID=V2WUN9_MONRO|nr:hypothetical protein Moror_11341 [Moniliophthora roreri MCA 2997]
MCNLLFHLLSTHPSFTATAPGPLSFAIPSLFGPESSSRGPYVSKETYQETLDQLQKSTKDIEKTNAIPLSMEHPVHILPRSTLNDGAKYPHSYQSDIQIVDRGLDIQEQEETTGLASLDKTNPTIFSDRFFFSITSPMITIRHPARMLPSYLRALSFSGVPMEGNLLHNYERVSRYRWERLIFESYKSRGTRVIVVDGERLVKDSEGQMKKVCEELGLDESQIRYTWDSADRLYSHIPESAKLAFMGTLHGSKGVIHRQGNDETLDLAAEERKWAKEWNEELARMMSYDSWIDPVPWNFCSNSIVFWTKLDSKRHLGTL